MGIIIIIITFFFLLYLKMSDDDFIYDDDDESGGFDDFGSDGDFGGFDDDMNNDDNVGDDCDMTFDNSSLRRSVSFEVLKEELLLGEAEKLSADVGEILGISPQVASALLRYYKWNREKLVEAYMDNSEEVCKKVGIA